MANPERGEVRFEFDGKSYTFKFSNAGKRAMQSFTGWDGLEIADRINTGRFDESLITGLFFGATRKFHARQFPNDATVDNFIDRINDEEDENESTRELLVTLLAAYLRQDPKEIRRGLFGTGEDEDAPEVDEPPAETDGDEAPKGDPEKSRSGDGSAS